MSRILRQDGQTRQHYQWDRQLRLPPHHLPGLHQATRVQQPPRQDCPEQHCLDPPGDSLPDCSLPPLLPPQRLRLPGSWLSRLLLHDGNVLLDDDHEFRSLLDIQELQSARQHQVLLTVRQLLLSRLGAQWSPHSHGAGGGPHQPHRRHQARDGRCQVLPPGLCTRPLSPPAGPQSSLPQHCLLSHHRSDSLQEQSLNQVRQTWTAPHQAVEISTCQTGELTTICMSHIFFHPVNFLLSL